MALYNKVCAWCGEHYVARNTRGRFCTTSCRCYSHRDKAQPHKEYEQAQQTVSSYLMDAVKQLTDTELMSALATLWTETKEERAQRKESLLYTLLKNKEHLPQ